MTVLLNDGTFIPHRWPLTRNDRRPLLFPESINLISREYFRRRAVLRSAMSFFPTWLETRDKSDTSPGDDCKSVWLECNDDLADSSLVKIRRVRRSPLGFEMLGFVCPRGKRPREPLRFR